MCVCGCLWMCAFRGARAVRKVMMRARLCVCVCVGVCVCVCVVFVCACVLVC